MLCFDTGNLDVEIPRCTNVNMIENGFFSAPLQLPLQRGSPSPGALPIFGASTRGINVRTLLFKPARTLLEFEVHVVTLPLQCEGFWQEFDV